MFRRLFVVTAATLALFVFSVVLIGLLYATGAAQVGGLLIAAFLLVQYPIFRLLTRLGLWPRIQANEQVDSR